MTKLDILFVNTNSSESNYQELAKKYMSVETPIWCGMLANATRVKGFSTKILDCEAERLDHLESAKAILDHDAKLVCLVCYAQNPNDSTSHMTGVSATSKFIKQLDPSQKIVAVGPHMAALPRECLVEEESLDFICQNEGVYTILNLLKVQDLNDEEQLKKVKGLGFRSKNYKRKSLLKLLEDEIVHDMNIVLNEPEIVVPRHMLKEDLPGVAWDLLPPPSKYRTSGWHALSNGTDTSPFASLYTSLGCPNKCFPAGTKIITSDCPNKKIEDVRPGDKLISLNEKTGLLEETTVSETKVFLEKELLEIIFDNGSKIKCTAEHPFYVKNRWIKAEDLKIDDEIYHINQFDKISLNKKWYNPVHRDEVYTHELKDEKTLLKKISDFTLNGLKIKEINKIKLDNEIRVYNFSCYPHQNYFVSGNKGQYILSHNCSFCIINIINRRDNSPGIASADSNMFRYWEPEYMITHFDRLAEMGVKNIKIADELFVMNPNHFLKLCELIKERGHKFNIWCYSRVDTCKPQYLKALKDAGVNWLALGIENPNQTMRREFVKGGFEEVKVTDLMKDIHDAGINIIGNYIFGLPPDTHESMKETLEFAKSNLTEAFNLYPAQALPGSPLYLQARKEGWRLPDRYAGYSMLRIPHD